MRIVVVGTSGAGKTTLARRIAALLLQEIGREPTPGELAERLAMPLEKMRKVLLAKQPIRLEAPIPEDGDSSCGDPANKSERLKSQLPPLSEDYLRRPLYLPIEWCLERRSVATGLPAAAEASSSSMRKTRRPPIPSAWTRRTSTSAPSR